MVGANNVYQANLTEIRTKIVHVVPRPNHLDTHQDWATHIRLSDIIFISNFKIVTPKFKSDSQKLWFLSSQLCLCVASPLMDGKPWSNWARWKIIFYNNKWKGAMKLLGMLEDNLLKKINGRAPTVCPLVIVRVDFNTILCAKKPKFWPTIKAFNLQGVSEYKIARRPCLCNRRNSWDWKIECQFQPFFFLVIEYRTNVISF